MPHTLDLQFLGRAGVIATAAIPCDGGVILVDPGPTSCLAALTAALATHGYGPVSYTHLDVYKRQRHACAQPAKKR